MQVAPLARRCRSGARRCRVLRAAVLTLTKKQISLDSTRDTAATSTEKMPFIRLHPRQHAPQKGGIFKGALASHRRPGLAGTSECGPSSATAAAERACSVPSPHGLPDNVVEASVCRHSQLAKLPEAAYSLMLIIGLQARVAQNPKLATLFRPFQL